jgi:hypothetical protein
MSKCPNRRGLPPHSHPRLPASRVRSEKRQSNDVNIRHWRACFIGCNGNVIGGSFYDFSKLYFIQHCFICLLSDSTVSEDAGIEAKTVETLALAVRHTNHSARSQPICGQLILIQFLNPDQGRLKWPFKTGEIKKFRV